MKILITAGTLVAGEHHDAGEVLDVEDADGRAVKLSRKGVEISDDEFARRLAAAEKAAKKTAKKAEPVAPPVITPGSVSSGAPALDGADLVGAEGVSDVPAGETGRLV